jgi:glycosyltransferase involved in cell wall biosynthesis
VKVLFPFVGDSIGGSHNSVMELYNVLKDSSIVPIFVLHKKGPLSDLFDKLNIQYKYIHIDHLAGDSPSLFKISFYMVFNFYQIIKFIYKNKIDAVHGNDLRINLTWSLPTRLSGSIYIWHQRSIISSSLLWRVIPVLANHFISISKYVHNSLPINISNHNKTLVLNPFNTKKKYKKSESRRWLNELYGIPSNSVLLGYIGRLVDWKNLDFLINCFAEYSNKSDKSLHLIIVGTGGDEYISFLTALVDKLNINNIVTFAGFNADPSRVIAAFDLMVAPSNKEPFGRTLVESMIQKTPVLAARGGGHSEIIDNGVTGRFYNHLDIDDFISQCDICINNGPEVKIINNANIIAYSKYSSSQHAENIIQIYQKHYSYSIT